MSHCRRTIPLVPLRVIPTPYGREASEVLRAEIARVKASEPIAPVTVVVPTNSVGVAARRLLASGELGQVIPDRPGLIGVTFLTVFRLAELLAAARLAASGRRPVSTPVVAAAIRPVLASESGMFAPVAEHPATEEALVAAHRELADIDDAALDVLSAQSPRARDVVRIHRSTRRRLRDHWYDEDDLMRVASEVVAEGSPLLADLGPIVCHLPQRWSGPAARLLAALAEQVDVVIVTGLTGVPAADAAVVASVERVGGKIEDLARTAMTPAHGTGVLSTSDPDDEVRAVVRGVVDAMRGGVPAERMAIVYASDDPYARILHEHLELAGIAHNGMLVATLAESVLGQGLLRLLALPDTDFRRDDVFAWLASAPVLDGHGRFVPRVPWERVSRYAGVVGGVDEWRARLDAYAEQLGAEGWDKRERERTVALRTFIDSLAADLTAHGVDGRASSWPELAAWAHRLVRRWFGDERRREPWPAFEQEAARRVEAALDRLAGLGTVEPAVTLDVFRRTLELELRAMPARLGRLGEGVLVGSVVLSLGVEFERVWVCGLAEGVFPAVPRDDPLLGDADRGALAGELPLRAERTADEHRRLLAVLASTSGARVMCFPRGDLRRTTEHVPSRFLLDTVEALTGVRPHGELGSGAPEADESWCSTIPSFVHGVAHAAFPATKHELSVGAAAAAASWVQRVPEVAGAVELTRARRSRAFTRFDGNLGALGASLRARSPAADGVVVSPTRLEHWAVCPHAYFVRHVLHVEAVERPEAIEQISPLERGSLVHAILDRFMTEASLGVAGRTWTDADRDLLRTIAEDECAAVEARGLVGRRLLWERDRRQILSELDGFLTADEQYRVSRGVLTLATEMRLAGEVALDDGRRVHLRGHVDRLDVDADCRLIVVDYKTSKPDSYRGLGPDNAVEGGTRLQLPAYAHMALAATSEDSRIDHEVPVDARYWFIGRGNNQQIGYPVDNHVDAQFKDALTLIVDGIEAGCLVAYPPKPGPHFYVECEYCDPDNRGTADRWREWERKQDDPALAPFLGLLGIEEEDE
jgi:ATP-dependent helicase/nuclease subunit B